MIKNGLRKEAEAQMLNVLSRVEMFICLLLESARIRGRENALSSLSWSVLLLASEEEKSSGERYTAFYDAQGGNPGRMASVILIGRNI